MTSALSPWAVALGCRCPRCGRGKLFAGFLTVAERCEVCGLDLKKADAGDGPAVFVIFIVGALSVLAAILTEIWFAPPYWLHLVIWPVVILGSSLGLLRPLKALLIALQFKHRASDSGNVHYD